jgi:hypothetical protein
VAHFCRRAWRADTSMVCSRASASMVNRIIDPRHNARGNGIAGIKPHGLEKVSPRMRPARRMHQLRPTDSVVGGIAVALQNAFEVFQEPPRPLAAPAQTKVKCLSRIRFVVHVLRSA